MNIYLKFCIENTKLHFLKQKKNSKTTFFNKRKEYCLSSQETSCSIQIICFLVGHASSWDNKPGRNRGCEGSS